MSSRLKIINIVGARRNLPKIAPLMREMQRHLEIEPITISEGTNLLIGTDPSKIRAAAQQVLSGKGKPGRIPPFWDGHAAERIVEVLLRKSPLGTHRKSTLPVT
jgi:UDP-N-acetylglucosamine 2-epimerase